MSIKKKVITALKVLIPLLLVGVLFNRCLNVVNSKLDKNYNDTQTESNTEADIIAKRKAEYEKDEYYFDNIITKYANNKNIELLPITKSFVDHFKAKISSKIQNAYSITYMCYTDNAWHNKIDNIMTLRTQDDNLKNIVDIKIHYTYNDKYELDDLEILEEKQITDEYGNMIEYDTIHTEPLDVAKFVLFKNTIHDVLKVTENFAKKYPNYSTKPIFDNFSIISTIRDFDEFKRKLAYDDIKNYVSLDKNEFLLEMLNSDSTIYYKIKMYIKDGILDDMDILLVKEYPAVEDLNEFR